MSILGRHLTAIYLTAQYYTHCIVVLVRNDTLSYTSYTIFHCTVRHIPIYFTTLLTAFTLSILQKYQWCSLCTYSSHIFSTPISASSVSLTAEPTLSTTHRRLIRSSLTFAYGISYCGVHYNSSSTYLLVQEGEYCSLLHHVVHKPLIHKSTAGMVTNT